MFGRVLNISLGLWAAILVNKSLFTGIFQRFCLNLKLYDDF